MMDAWETFVGSFERRFEFLFLKNGSQTLHFAVSSCFEPSLHVNSCCAVIILGSYFLLLLAFPTSAYIFA